MRGDSASHREAQRYEELRVFKRFLPHAEEVYGGVISYGPAEEPLPDIVAEFGVVGTRGFELVEVAEEELKRNFRTAVAIKDRLQDEARQVGGVPVAFFALSFTKEGRERPGLLFRGARQLVEFLRDVPADVEILDRSVLPRGYKTVTIRRSSLSRPVFLPPMVGAWVGESVDKVVEHLLRRTAAPFPVDVLAHFCPLRGAWLEGRTHIFDELQKTLAASEYDQLWIYSPGDDRVIECLAREARGSS